MIPAGYWRCGCCTSNNPEGPFNTFCSVCHSIHGMMYAKKLDNYFVSSLIKAPSQIFPWLYLGSEEATYITNPPQGWSQKFTTVVACMNHPPPGWGHLGAHHHIVLNLSGGLGSSISPEGYVPLLASFTPAFQALDDARANGGCVYVHCQHGMSRSVGVVAAYLLTRFPTGDLFDMVQPSLSAGTDPTRLSKQLDGDPLEVIMVFLKKRREACNPAGKFMVALQKLSKLVLEQKEDGVVPDDGDIGECTIA